MVLTLYLAGPLFNVVERYFNEELAKKLGVKHDVILPQSEGFMFPKLLSKLGGKFDDIERVAKNMIYYLDMGRLIPESDVIVANINEPIDPGTLVEMMHGRYLGKYVISYRNEMRMPFGSPFDAFNGAHTFAVYQSDAFITLEDNPPLIQLEELSDKILSLVRPIDENNGRKPLVRNPIIENADILFDGLVSFDSDDALDMIISRYKNHQEKLEGIMPKIK